MSYVSKFKKLDVELPARHVDDWLPTAHGEFLATYLAETNFCNNKHVLELGAGTGIHSVFICRQLPSRLTCTEYKRELIETTKQNLRSLHVPCSIEFVVADWLQVPDTYDVIITNPPFSRCPIPNDRRHFIDRLINNSRQRLQKHGELVFVQSSMANIHLTKDMLTRQGFDVSIPQSITGPFRQDYYDNQEFMDEVRAFPEGYTLIDGVDYETLYIVHATL